MADNPGAFGIDHLTERVNELEQVVVAGFRRLERAVSKMATRADLEAMKANLVDAIKDAANRVTNDIQDLRDQLKAGGEITDQDLADLQADIDAIGAIDPALPPPP
jgi:DNA-binding ferritin-like protein